MIVSVESENWIKSPWLTNLVASPPNPLHSIYFLPLVPLKVKLVIDVLSANFSLLTSTSEVNLLAFPDPYSQKNDLTFCGVYVDTEFLTRTGVITDAVGLPPPSPWITLMTGGFAYSSLNSSLLEITALTIAPLAMFKLTLDESNSTPSILNFDPSI